MTKSTNDYLEAFDKRFGRFGKDVLIKEHRAFLLSTLQKQKEEIAKAIDSFPLQDDCFFNSDNWDAGYKALEEFKEYLLRDEPIIRHQ